jgi:mono/diheme cytochrome c family protein
MSSKSVWALLLALFLFVVGCKEDAVSKAAMNNGKKVYDNYCLGCHMQDAMGVPGLNPPLAGSGLLLTDKIKPIRIVLRGSDELQDQPKRDYKNAMAALNTLTDQEIADVLTFARNSFGNKGTVVTADEVKQERANIK